MSALRWRPATFFRGLVCNRAPFYFEIRPYTPPKGALKAHRICLRVYPHKAPINALAEWPMARGYAKPPIISITEGFPKPARRIQRRCARFLCSPW
jgi:hypothetical protein